MKLMYCATSKGNFGDDLNLWLWNELFPEGFFDDDESTQFYGIGTILHRKIDPAANKVVFGSGARRCTILPLPRPTGWPS